MKITKIFKDNMDDFQNVKKPTIAFFGDSITQGCFESYMETNGEIETYFEQEYAYHRYVQKILAMLYPRVPVNIINAGLSCGNAPQGLERIERDVICFNPDLTVVCFGLNDSTGGEEKLDLYYDSLVAIFNKLKDAGSEVIFMTPNMMNTHLSAHLDTDLKEAAENCMKIQNEGILEKYIDKAKSAAKLCDVRVCDVYSKWKILNENGVNITELLANKINHPTHEMNWVFAYSLVEEMMK